MYPVLAVTLVIWIGKNLPGSTVAFVFVNAKGLFLAQADLGNSLAMPKY